MTFENLYDQYLLTYPTPLSYKACVTNHNYSKCEEITVLYRNDK